MNNRSRLVTFFVSGRDDSFADFVDDSVGQIICTFKSAFRYTKKHRVSYAELFH